MGFNQEAVPVELAKLLRHLCNDEQLELEVDMPLEAIPGIDSLHLLQAVAHFEEHFRVEIDVVAIDAVYRVHDIVNAITAARLQQRDGSAKRSRE